MKFSTRLASARGNVARGFTLIELMIAISIVAILVAFAVPAYQDYTVRSKVAECINGAAVAKVQIAEYRQAFGDWPQSASEAAIDASGISKFCDGFSGYDNTSGSFIVGVDETAVEPTIIAEIAPVLEPSLTASGFINWKCSRGTTSASNTRYLPGPCRGT